MLTTTQSRPSLSHFMFGPWSPVTFGKGTGISSYGGLNARIRELNNLQPGLPRSLKITAWSPNSTDTWRGCFTMKATKPCLNVRDPFPFVVKVTGPKAPLVTKPRIGVLILHFRSDRNVATTISSLHGAMLLDPWVSVLFGLLECRIHVCFPSNVTSYTVSDPPSQLVARKAYKWAGPLRKHHSSNTRLGLCFTPWIDLDGVNCYSTKSCQDNW